MRCKHWVDQNLSTYTEKTQRILRWSVQVSFEIAFVADLILWFRSGADVIIKFFKFKSSVKYPEFWEIINNFLHTDREHKLRMWYKIFDVDHNGEVSIQDVMTYINRLHFTDWFLKNDALNIFKFFETKMNNKKVKEFELDFIIDN